MDSLNDAIQAYTNLLRKGQIQKAYRGILGWMADLRGDLEENHPEDMISALYTGTMDMTYFAMTPAALKGKGLKIAIVYLHQEGRFEVWLCGSNRRIQAEYLEKLGGKDLGSYALSQPGPGVDAIIANVLEEDPDFDHPEALKRQIEKRTLEFTQDVLSILG